MIIVHMQRDRIPEINGSELPLKISIISSQKCEFQKQMKRGEDMTLIVRDIFDMAEKKNFVETASVLSGMRDRGNTAKFPTIHFQYCPYCSYMYRSSFRLRNSISHRQ